MRELLGGHGWAGRDLLDLGCGTGFHLPRWAVEARSVVGVEPHPDLAALAARRTARLDNVTVLPGTAQRIPLADASVDVVQVQVGVLLRPGLRARAARGRPGRPARRHRVRHRQRPHAQHVRRVVPPRLPDGARGRGGTVLVHARLAPTSRWTSSGGSPTAPASRRACASSSTSAWPPRCWPATRAPRSTTPSTSGGSGSSDYFCQTLTQSTCIRRRQPGVVEPGSS